MVISRVAEPSMMSQSGQFWVNCQYKAFKHENDWLRHVLQL